MNFSRTAAVLRRASIVATLAVLVSASAAGAATFNVNTTADTTVANGCTTDPTCSLRDAITAAGAGADASNEIVLPEGQITLSSGPLTLATAGKTYTLTGQGAGKSVIDGNNASRVLFIDGVAATVRSLSITRGRALTTDGGIAPGDGGGVLVRGQVVGQPTTFDKVDISANTAQLSGGGISGVLESMTPPNFVITDSTISSNKVTGGMVSAQGGAIFTPGDATITNSTITGNTIDSSVAGTSRGGGIAAIANVNSGTSTIKLLNSTVVNNAIDAGAPGTSFGGGYAGDAPGGVTTNLQATNTIIAGNTFAGAANDCGMGMGLTTTSDNSLSSDASCGFTDEGSLQNTDPKLGPLAPDNGGPTATHYPGAGSPTFDAGASTDCPAADQRGVTRPKGKACDIGSVEVTPNADLAVTTSVDPVNSMRGQNVTFKVDVRNLGPQPATGVSVRIGPVNGTFVSAAGATCSGDPIACALPDVATGGTVSFTYVVNATAAGVLQGPATVSGTYPDPDTGNNTFTAYSYVTDPASPVQPVQPKLTLSSSITKVKKGRRYKISARGKLTGTQGRACSGFVLIDVKVKTRRVILRRTPLKANCTYARTFEFNPSRVPRRLRASRRQLFKVVANYTGTAQLRPARVIKNIRSKR
jgi:CSLREA domain-containing protein/uncharacterized repeat protein (TIGR01451 family)